MRILGQEIYDYISRFKDITLYDDTNDGKRKQNLNESND